MSSSLPTVTDATYDAEVVRAPGPILLDFWADWCGPCKSLAPILDDIADDYAGSLRVAKIDADANRASAERLSVRGLPTLVLMDGGVERGRLVGLVTKTRLASFLDGLLAT